MDIRNLPNKIIVHLPTGATLEFSQPKVVYSTSLLSKDTLDNIVSLGGLKFEEVVAKPVDSTISSAITAETIAEFATNQMRLTGIAELADAKSWTVKPILSECNDEKDVRLSLIVTP